jgi:hypothetical protein
LKTIQINTWTLILENFIQKGKLPK